MAWGSHSEKEMIIGKVIFEISRKNDVHNNYETDYRPFDIDALELSFCLSVNKYIISTPNQNLFKLQN